MDVRLEDIKAGMKLKAVGNYADCIKAGDEFTVYDLSGSPHIRCRGPDGMLGPGGCHHGLASAADDAGEIPELDLAE